MTEITEEQIKKLAADENNIQLTIHVSDRCRQRKIDLDDVVRVLRNGKIIENLSSQDWCADFRA